MKKHLGLKKHLGPQWLVQQLLRRLGLLQLEDLGEKGCNNDQHIKPRDDWRC